MKATHCRNGHEFTGDNVYLVPSTGARQCRTCKAATQRAYYARNRERLLQGKREYNERTDYMRKWHERNREHELEYRKAYRARGLELRRTKYSADYERSRNWRSANRERVNALARARSARNKDLLRAKRMKGKENIKAAIGDVRTGRYSAAEDAIVFRDDLTVLEKAFILKRAPSSITARKSYLSDATRARLDRQREQLVRYHQTYRQLNRERLAEKERLYRESNKEKLRQKRALNYARNPEKRKAEVREWRSRNPEKVREYYLRSAERKREQRAVNKQRAAS